MKVRVEVPAEGRERRRRPSRADNLAAEIERARRGASTPLPDELRRQMEARFGADFSRVRVHADGHAAATARSLGARAFTVGDEIFFAAGLYRPESVEGRRLLAHELAHVLQSPLHERASEPLRGADLAGDAGREREAREAAGRAESGRPLDRGMLTPRATAEPRLARFVDSLPTDRAVVPLANPFVEQFSLDVVRALQLDPDDHGGHTRRRLRRLDEQTRAAVAGRAQELLPPALRERCAVALTAAATDTAEREMPPASAPSAPLPTPAQEPAPAERPARAEAQTSATAEAESAEPPAPAAPETQAAAAPAPGPTQAARPSLYPAMPAIGPAAGVQAAAAAAPEAAEPSGEARAAAAAPGPPEAATPGAASAESSAAAAAGMSEGGDAGAQADLGPMSELENKVEARDRQRLAAAQREVDAAHEDAAAAAPGAAPVAEEAAEPTPASPVAAEQPATPESEPAVEPEPAAEAAPEPQAEAALATEAAPESSQSEAPPEPTESAEPQAAGPESEQPAPATAPEPTPTESPPAAPAPEPVQPGQAEPVAQSAPATPEPEAAVEAQATQEPAAAEPSAEDGGAEPAAPEGETAAPDAAGPPAEAAGAEPEAAAQGDCGPDTAGGSGAGGGGGAPIEDQPEPPAPETAQADPVDAMGSVSSLPPQQVARALGGVGTAANREVGEQRQELAASPPSLERPSGAPQTRPAGAASPSSAQGPASAAARLERAQRGSPPPHSTQPPPLPQQPPSPTRAVTAPSIAGGAQAQVTAEQAQAIRNAVDELPTHDPGLDITADPAPTLELTGAADPQHVSDQRAELDRSTQSAQEEGARDVATPLGEHDVYPTVPPETLHAELPSPAQAPAVAGAAPAPAGAQAPVAGSATAQQAGPASATDDAIAIVARERDSETVQTAALQGRAQMLAGRQQHETDVSAAQETSRNDVAQLERTNSDEQTRRRNETLTEVHRQRGNWSRDQQAAVTDSRREADEQHDRVEHEVTRPHADAEQAAAHEIEKGNRDAAVERRKGEENAARERQKGREESRGVLGWLADRARSFFNRIRNAIKAAFDAARALVRHAIDAAKRLANNVIDAARRAIVSAIRSIGERLAQIGDVLLAAFPTLRDRFRRAITRVVDAAVAEVNRLADALKEGIQRALNLLGAALDAALGLLERAYLAAVDAVASVVNGVINAARAVVNALATWAALIRDIASNPVQWIRNLGASASDGIRNHLWRALKCAVKEWFNSKVEEVLGLPLALFNLLRSGGIRLAEIGHMVWEGLKAAIPGILIQLAIEKIVAMIIPAAGAIMAIIEALQAAWGTIQRILSAFERFFAFLRAVKGGRAGPQFASMIAAAAVVVLDFLANFLVRRLMRPARPVAGRLAALGRRIMARLSGAVRAVGRGLRRVAQAVRRGAQRAAAIVRRAAGAVRTAAGRVSGAMRRGATRALAAVRRVGGRVLGVVERRLPRVAAMMRRIGGAARRLGARTRRAYRRVRARIRRWRARRRRRRRETPEERRERARRETRVSLERSIGLGLPFALLRAQIAYLRYRWGWRSLRLARGESGTVQVVGELSPPEVLVSAGTGWEVLDTQIRLQTVPSSGAHYEAGVLPIASRTIVPRIAPSGRAITFHEPRFGDRPASPHYGDPSTLTTTRVHFQRLHRVGGFSRRPEMIFDVPQIVDPSTRRTEILEVHLIEVTQVTTFRATSGPGWHKRVQLPSTLLNMTQRYPHATVTYHVIVPRHPDPGALRELEAAMSNLPPRIHFVFRIVGY